mgnify:FL=1
MLIRPGLGKRYFGDEEGKVSDYSRYNRTIAAVLGDEMLEFGSHVKPTICRSEAHTEEANDVNTLPQFSPWITTPRCCSDLDAYTEAGGWARLFETG